MLGFLDLQAGQAQNRFYNELEEWLSTYTRLSSGAFGEAGDGSVPAYIQALLEQTADSLENLQRIVARSEESRIGANSDARRPDRPARHARRADEGRADPDAAARREPDGAEAVAGPAGRRSPRTRSGRTTCCATICATSRPISRGSSEDVAEGRAQSVQDLRGDIRLVARTIAALAEEARR